MNYKVSLIIPCFNIESLSNNSPFEKTFQSILEQSIGFENIELLLIDDASTDNSFQILEKLSFKYPNIKIFSLPENTGGPSIPRNIGIENATSNYLMFLDEDDCLNPKMIEKVYEYINKSDYDMVKTDFNVVIDGKINKKDMGINESLIVGNKSANLKFVSLYVWDCIYNKKFLLDNNIRFENVRGEDFLFTIECISKTNKNIYLINDFEGLDYNSDNISSLSHNCFDLINLKEQIYVSKKCLDLILDGNFSTEYIEFLSTFLKFSLMIYLFYSNNSPEIKDEMYLVLKKFLNEYGNINFIKINELKYPHYIIWKSFNYLIKNNHKSITFLLINILKKIKTSTRT